MNENILEVSQLTTSFKTGRTRFNAVDGISFNVAKGEILGIVGESGCGKSVTSLSIMGLIKHPGEIKGEKVLFNGTDLLGLNKKGMRKIRGKDMAMIFQEPMTSLNPVYQIGNQIGEVLKIHKGLKGKKLKEQVVELLKVVGIPRPDEIYYNYPHQLSGGMRQRVMIAIAMACSPKLLIADEPTTALDVTIQAQILELMKELQLQNRMSMILITHDLGVVAEICDRVIVMYAGSIVEMGSVKDILRHSRHPYTSGLLASLPKKGRDQKRLHYIPGQVPAPTNWGKGCRFADRCPFAMEKCSTEKPPLFNVDDHQQVACWLVNEEGRDQDEYQTVNKS